jgi:fatty acid desaturase
MGAVHRALLLFNQTLLGRLSIGPLLRLSILVRREGSRLGRRDFSHVSTWLVHFAAVAVLLWICHLYGMQWWKYVLLVAYPGMSLGLLRAFTEHRAAPGPSERTASVESNTLFGLLFLYNNLHIAHHLQPTMQWFELPAYYRKHRESLLKLRRSLRISRLCSNHAALSAAASVSSHTPAALVRAARCPRAGD